MKLVEILAKEMDVWPLDAAWVGQAVDGDIHVNNSDDEFIRHTGVLLTRADDWNAAEINQAQWQAERDRQKGGEWKRAHGRKPKYETETPQRMEVRHRDGDITQGWTSQSWNWSHNDGCPSADIMAWRIISQPQADEIKLPFPRIPVGEQVPEVNWDVEFPSGSCDIEQFDGPLRWRDEVTELNAYIEKYTRERDDLIERLASEGFALISPTVSVVSDINGLSIPLEDCKIGDIVEVISLEGFCGSSVQVGDQMPITSVDSRDGTVQVACGTWGDEDNYKFIRRP